MNVSTCGPASTHRPHKDIARFDREDEEHRDELKNGNQTRTADDLR